MAYHRALISLVSHAEEQVAQASRALLAADENLKTIRHLVEQEHRWHEEHVKRPEMYSYGPLEGSKKNLARWIFPDLKDPRCLENANQTPGIVWVIRLNGNRPEKRFQVWFTSNSMFSDAQTRKIGKLKTR